MITRWPGTFLLLSLCCCLLLSARCDSTNLLQHDHALTPSSQAFLTVNDLEVRLDSSGAIRGVFWPEATLRNFLSDAGLWLAGMQDGEMKSMVRAFSQSNYSAHDGDQRLGVFTLTPDSLRDVRITNWPIAYGAPVRENGQPFLFGDMMLWTALLPEKNPRIPYDPETLYASPLTGLHISQAIYGYQNAALRNVIFVRYEIINHSGPDLSDLHVGFYADVDLTVFGCYTLLSNATGYDVERALSYTYPYEATGDQALECPTSVLGLAFLESPIASEPPHTTSSHTISRKNIEVDFSEATLKTPQDIYFRLKGLSSTGAPMIDPTTGLPTPYAFTGDPVGQTGWLDVPLEVRSLIGAGPFSLGRGQKKVLTVALVAAQGMILSEALAHLRQQVDMTISQPDKWRF